MGITVVIKSEHVEVKTQRETAAQRVINHFGHALPDTRLLCFFDDQDWQLFKSGYGAANRGLAGPIRDDTPWAEWPHYVTDFIFVDDLPNLQFHRAFDHIIYLHGGTCASTVGLTMTLAHELQHFVQYHAALRVWAENGLIRRLIKTFDQGLINSLDLTWSDIPIEREARAVSKHTAEQLLGAKAVAEYIDARISEHVDATDVADWEYVRSLDVSSPYCLESETRLIFRRLKKYRPELESILQELHYDPDFKDINLDALFHDAPAAFAPNSASSDSTRPPTEFSEIRRITDSTS